MVNFINRFTKFGFMVGLLGIILTALFNKFHIWELNAVTYFICFIGFLLCGWNVAKKAEKNKDRSN